MFFLCSIIPIETNKRYVKDYEIRAFAQLFDVSYDYLIDLKPMNYDFISHVHRLYVYASGTVITVI
ncbi:hypothetical protein [uncultured Eubacterium sp.]|uniref:hypothetical protein n=1 Tax=uncultured Eubacterium sp. TaxID=165185 RepID=UPI0026720564|nr:hypothetical protein [uncultured Eubacterium sp.]